VTTPPVGGASPPTGQVRLPTPGSPLPDPPQGAVNVALNKPAYQSSRSRISRPNDPQGAVDGVRDGTFGFHTDWEVHPWWLVDLGQAYLLQQLRVYNCLEYSERARFLQIDVSLDGQRWQRVHSHDGAVFGGVDGRALIVNLTNGHARYLLLRPGDAAPHYLHLDEVEAYGTPVALPTGTAPAGQQPTTPILTPQTGGTWNHGLQLDLVGGRLTIVGVAPGSASAVPLFQTGDEIVRINGADTQMMTMGNVRYLLQLPVGGQVTIQFVRPGTGLSGTLILTRQ